MGGSAGRAQCLGPDVPFVFTEGGVLFSECLNDKSYEDTNQGMVSASGYVSGVIFTVGIKFYRTLCTPCLQTNQILVGKTYLVAMELCCYVA